MKLWAGAVRTVRASVRPWFRRIRRTVPPVVSTDNHNRTDIVYDVNTACQWGFFVRMFDRLRFMIVYVSPRRAHKSNVRSSDHHDRLEYNGAVKVR